MSDPTIPALTAEDVAREIVRAWGDRYALFDPRSEAAADLEDASETRQLVLASLATAIRSAVSEAYERAAKIAETYSSHGLVERQIAAAIRAFKDRAP